MLNKLECISLFALSCSFYLATFKLTGESIDSPILFIFLVTVSIFFNLLFLSYWIFLFFKFKLIQKFKLLKNLFGVMTKTFITKS